MFSSVHRCTGDLTCEVLILTCFGNLPPDRQLYLGMGTMIVKETIRRGRTFGVSAGGDVSACRRVGVCGRAPGISTRAAPIRPDADPYPRPTGIFGWQAEMLRHADPPTRPTPTRLPLARELNSPFISHGVSRVRTSHLAQIDSDLYLSP